MAWEQRGGKRYFYHAVRAGGAVKKVYHGLGPSARLAAEALDLQRDERAEEEEARRSREEVLETARALTRAFAEGCDLLAAASLLAAGYHRPYRHKWRIWKHGRKALAAAG